MEPSEMERPVITMLEASVAPERWTELEQLFRKAGSRLPRQMLHNYLVQEAADPTIWRAVSIWRSRAALGEYRQSVETPEGVRMFQEVDAKPSLSISTVITSSHAADSALRAYPRL